MPIKSIERWLAPLSIIILGTLYFYRSSSRLIVAGGPFLAVAALLCFLCSFELLKVKAQRNQIQSSALRAQIILLIAWQLTIVGIAHIWSTRAQAFPGMLLLSYVLIGINVFIWDRLIGMAEDPKQDGGAKPLHWMGLQRSRRLFFCIFSLPLYVPYRFRNYVAAKGSPYPKAFHPPELCLLLSALFSLGGSILVFHRYRQASVNQTEKRILLIGMLFVFGIFGVSRLFVQTNSYIEILSTLVLANVFLCAYSFSKARVSWSGLIPHGVRTT